jgi:membrane associated rhomboid family serine protease
MLLPLDRRINDHVPFATYGLAAANIGLFFASFVGAGGASGLEGIWNAYGFIPALPYPAHAGWEHLAGNMLFLVLMGMNVERRLGTALFLAFYFLSGLGALALFWAFHRGSPVPLGGASGAVSGVTGMYLALFARREVEVLWFAGCAAGTLRVAAWVITVLWAALEVVQAAIPNPAMNVANWAHVGGFLVGLGGTAALMRGLGYEGRPVRHGAGPEPRRGPDRFEELSYLPAPGGAAPPGRYLLVARQYGPIPAAAAALLGGKRPAACLARGLSYPAAQDLAARLGGAGYPVFLSSERHLVKVPPLRPAQSVSFEERRAVFRDGDGAETASDLAALYFLSAGSVATAGGVRTFIDLFATSPWTDHRVSCGDPAALARELRVRAARVPAAKNLAALAEGGTVPGEPFRDLTEYDAFNHWMLQVHASGIYRTARD